ncbi:hypothetical protein CDAR_20421 [Caerostris darwini]|uniref:Uncharacterized protein n=1 Tax=Caerostris darwini TaxID=1538125 RepID=A0AAV4QD80_9ARAC|nr:hypothetical protein CDAR_20421 [Caerostris darwini]
MYTNCCDCFKSSQMPNSLTTRMADMFQPRVSSSWLYHEGELSSAAYEKFGYRMGATLGSPSLTSIENFISPMDRRHLHANTLSWQL